MSTARFLFIGLLVVTGHIYGDWKQPPHVFGATGLVMSLAADEIGNAIVVVDEKRISVEAFYYSKNIDTWLDGVILDNVVTDRVLVDMDPPSGRGIAIWSKMTEPAEVRSSTFDGVSWTPPSVVGKPSGVRTIALDMNGPDSALAVWVENATNLVYASFYNGGVWGPETLIAHCDEEYLSASYSSNGTAIVGFINREQLLVSNYIGGIWQDPIMLSAPLSYDSSHGVGIDDNGKGVAVWVDHQRNVQASSFDGVTWASPINIRYGQDAREVTFGMAANGKAVAVCWDRNYNGDSMSYDGATWSSPQQVPELFYYGRLSINKNADVLLVCYNLQNEIKGVMLPFGGAWNAPELIYKPGPMNASFIFPALCDSGFALAGWAENYAMKKYSATTRDP